MTDDKNTPESAPTLKNERADNFISVYANNAFFEPNPWDLKIIFGQLDQLPDQPAVIRQNVAVTIPWAQAKLALYWLRLNVEATEIQMGKIPIRKELIPPEPPPLPPEEENNPDSRRVFELVQKLRDEFIASL